MCLWGEYHKIHIETANVGTRLGFKTPDISLLIIIIIILCVRVRVCVYLCVRVRYFLFNFACFLFDC